MNVAKIIKLKDHEQVLAVVRNHPLTYAGHWVLAFLFVAAAFFLMLPLFAAGWRGLAGFALLNVIGLYIAARTFVAWHWNAFIVTSVRVVDVGQKGFFDRTVSEATYDNVQNVSYAVQGVVGTVFRLGSVEVQTSSNSTTLQLKNAPNPKDVHHLITEAIAKHKGKPGAPASRTEKVSTLLESASELDDTEMRAVLTALQQSLNEKKNAPRRPPTAN
jgi:hypothetical protein